jgi:hypothetical protein
MGMAPAGFFYHLDLVFSSLTLATAAAQNLLSMEV